MDVVLGTTFVFVWLTPITYIGATDRFIPHLPLWWQQQCRIAELFPERLPEWPCFYLQGRVQGLWRTLDDREYFAMQPFGYQTRLDLLITDADGEENAARVFEEMAGYVRRRYEEAFPSIRLEALRCIEVMLPVGGDLARPPGAWVKPPLSRFPAERQRVVFSFTYAATSGDRAQP